MAPGLIARRMRRLGEPNLAAGAGRSGSSAPWPRRRRDGARPNPRATRSCCGRRESRGGPDARGRSESPAPDRSASPHSSMSRRAAAPSNVGRCRARSSARMASVAAAVGAFDRRLQAGIDGPREVSSVPEPAAPSGMRLSSSATRAMTVSAALRSSGPAAASAAAAAAFQAAVWLRSASSLFAVSISWATTASACLRNLRSQPNAIAIPTARKNIPSAGLLRSATRRLAVDLRRDDANERNRGAGRRRPRDLAVHSARVSCRLGHHSRSARMESADKSATLHFTIISSVACI